MKKHITLKQWNQLNEQQKEILWNQVNTIKYRPDTVVFLPAIGDLIDFLGDEWFHLSSTNRGLFTINQQIDFRLDALLMPSNNKLCDCLWKECVKLIRKRTSKVKKSIH